MKLLLCLAFCLSVSIGCTKKEDGDAPANVDPNVPTFTTPVTVSAKTINSFTLNWVGADDATPVASIQYKVVSSTSDNISTAASAEASGTLVMDWTVNALTTGLSALSDSTTYYFSVLAKDIDGNIGISTSSTITLCNGKIIFLANVLNGNLGGASGADGTCNANKPTGYGASTFKALLTDVATRRACYSVGNDNCGSTATGRLDWPLGATRNYCTVGRVARIGTTNALALLQVLTANVMTTTDSNTYTGFNSFWGSSATNCSNFASTASTGIQGSGNGTENGSSSHSFITTDIPSCTGAGTIYCVEQ